MCKVSQGNWFSQQGIGYSEPMKTYENANSAEA